MSAAETAAGSSRRAGGERMTAPRHVVLLPSWYTTPLEPVSGIFFSEQAQALARHGGLRVGVLAPIQRPVRSIARGGVAGYRFQVSEADEDGVPTLRALGWYAPRMPTVNRRMWLWMARRLLRTYVRRHGRPELIHAHSALSAGWPASVLSREWGIPYVVTEHTSLYAEGRIEEWHKPLIRTAFAGAGRAVAVSRALAAELVPYVGSTPVEVLPNLVDTTFFTLPGQTRGGGRYRFLNVGLSDPVKGVDVLLRGFAARFRGKDAELELGGGGALDGGHRALVAELGITDQVRFLGRLTREQVREAMWRADAYVLSSHVETFAVAVVEAMATGLPVVATACGGPQDTVAPGTGLLVPPGDHEALGAAMERVHAAAAEWSVRAPAIRAHVEAHFAQPVVVRAIAEMYERVLAAPRHAG